MMIEDVQLLKTILKYTGDAVIITDHSNLILSVNPQFEEITGYRQEELVGKSPKILGDGHNDASFSDEIKQTLQADGCWKGEIWTRHKTGDSILLNLFITHVDSSDGTPGNYVAFMNRPPVKPEVHIEASDRPNIDPLTNLPNRHLFQDRINQALIGARRGKKSVAALLIAMDRFSLINEGLGHKSGDDLLKEVTEKLHKCTRESDTIARIEGDHFALVMPVTTTDDIVIIAEKLLKSISEPAYINGHETVITSSIGISTFPDDSKDAEELVRHADSAMRYAKRSGGNQYQFFSSEMNVKAKKRLEMEFRIRQALAKDEFTLHYQPKVNVETGEIGGMEALARWSDPDKGMISPDIFIPIAEEIGLIEELGQWVLVTACRQNKEWQDKGLRPIRVSVNVSGRQFKDRHLVDKVAKILKETGLPPEYLEIELTESMLMDDVDEVIEKLHEFRELGIFISIDDFGTGYSNLSYLHSFPITTLKIDRVFVHDIENNPNLAEISRTIINLSKGLNLEIVAEGAETKEHVDFLRAHGCTMIQGFYYSHPLTAENFEKKLISGLG